MNTLKTIDTSYNFFITDPRKRYQRGLSLILRKNNSEISLEKAIFLSIILHPIVIVVTWLIIQVVTILFLSFGVDIPFLEKPEPKIQDIEFVLVAPENVEKVKPKKSIALADSLAGKRPDKRPFDDDSGSLKSSKVQKNTIANRNPAKLSNKRHTESTVPLTKKNFKGNAATRKNSQPDAFTLPVSKIKTMDAGFGADGDSGISSAGYSPVPVIASGEGAGRSGLSNNIGTGKRKGGGGYSYGTAGSPKLGSSGQSYNNELKDVDLGPYVSELQRRIKAKWAPPKGNENKKVELFLRIAKDGSLLVLNVKRTSSNPDVDNAAISAVKQTLPFRPLPAEYREKYADVVFTFDYNVSGRHR